MHGFGLLALASSEPWFLRSKGPVSLAGLLGLVERSELLRDGAETLPFVALSLWYFYRKLDLDYL